MDFKVTVNGKKAGVTQEVNLWCFDPAKNADKVYGLYLWTMGDGTYDLLALYGRRGGKLTPHACAEGVSLEEAERTMQQVLRTRKAHGYQQIAENVDALENKTPTVLYLTQGVA